jgi:chromate transporter
VLFLLFRTFFFIGAFSFGGGYAMLPLIQEEVVLNHQWLTMQQFSDIIAVAEMTPGPIAINTATFVGFKMAGIMGSTFATLGVILPSFILIVGLAGLVLKCKGNRYFKGAFAGLRPVVVALVVGAAFLIGMHTITSLKEIILFGIALGLMRKTSLHPVLIILGFGLLGVLIN